MKSIYSKAALRKSGKIKAFDALEKIYEGLNDTEKEKYFNNFADLFSFFTPKASSKKVKTPLEWVNLAVSKEATRYYLNAAYSDGKWLVATDGHRLHRIKTNLSVGYYDKMGNAIDLNGTFPDFNKLFFDTEGKIAVTLDIDKANLKRYGVKKTWIYVFNINGVEYAFNKKYMDEAFNGEKVLHGHIDTKLLDDISYLPFQSEDKTAILMLVDIRKIREKSK